MYSRTLSFSFVLIFSLSGVAALAQTAAISTDSDKIQQQDSARPNSDSFEQTAEMKRLFQFVDQGKYEEALGLANKVVTDQPGLPTGYELRSTIEYAMGLYQKATDDAAHATSLGSKKPAIVKLSKLTKEETRKKAHANEKVAEK